MEILAVKLNNQNATYTYDGKIVKINLDKPYKKGETFTLFFDYISKPNEIKGAEGLAAIKDDKGLYFINPLGEDKEKPMQIWTQGEPESNSVWFPTIDHPNERCTQEISITTENKYTAMSNGYLVSDVNNGNGTHTVTWKQDKPHAPYLFMMAIGDFAHVKDSYNGMSVDYFVEHEYESVAKDLFGKTPEMIGFFSKKLGVPYQWDKYWQVCVRDYVSGAMENTSAVIFGSFVQKNKRELLDDDMVEDIVSHELFHHWFGDLVTCESWANLPLNESFATYGEVLWREYKYGDDEKYRKLFNDMQNYFQEAGSGKQVDLIRFHNKDAEDMFDRHSYEKGGVVLNMLREVVGDEAFFESLRVYLEDNKYNAVEIHNLRLAFEKVTGKDLNWFFNQWFLSAGHPEITVKYTYTDTGAIVHMTQAASAEDNLTYVLPMYVDVYTDKGMETHQIVFDQKEQDFTFNTTNKIKLINVDAHHAILGLTENDLSKEQLVFQYYNGKNLLDKLYAIQGLSAAQNPTDDITNMLKVALNDKSWYIQSYAAASYPLEKTDQEAINILKDLAVNGVNSEVQSSAIFKLSEIEDPTLEYLYIEGLKDSSYRVNAASLEALMYTNPAMALNQAQEWENTKNYELLDAVAYVYSEEGKKDKASFFQKGANSDDEYERYYGVYYYSMFLTRMDKQTAFEGIDFIEKFGKKDDGAYSLNVAKSALNRIGNSFEGESEALKLEMSAEGLSKSQKMALENEIVDKLAIAERAKAAFEALK
ncbi:MAG: M1 family peptidase [Chitinophagales bacterium]|nr:M1 family peptidase [Chitinophagales bacterium]